MRFKIELQLRDKQNVLPLNYQYPLSSWIYKTLSNANKEFAGFLHKTGYQLENKKTFKLFTFSEMQIPKGKWKIIPNSDRMLIWAETISFKIAFQLPEQTENFIKGLFMNQNSSVGDVISKVNFTVKSVEKIKEIAVKENQIKLKTISPVVIAENIEGKKYETYLAPLSANYEKLIINNLSDKYKALKNHNKKESNNLVLNDLNIRIEIEKDNIRRKKITIKAHTENAIDIIAYKFVFVLHADIEIIELVINSGLGSMNSMGFGMCEEV